ncbi:50S ribosomal protein L35 [Patescibacteria group bacterium]|nr:50S ribosomal protein L35 [Patescibacteria group bacterium]
MPKIKTHKGAKKRFKFTKKGKLKRSSAYTSHLKAGKTSKRKRRLRKRVLLKTVDSKRIKRLLPGG